MYVLIRICLIQLSLAFIVVSSPEEEQGVKYANKCEVCKVVATELEARLAETAKTRDILEIGELRLVESMENLCERILKYNIHKERADSTRFAKGMSQTFKALHGLVDKGVKVELGIPYELWDRPSVEITTLKSQCEDLLENHESDIEDWYHNHQEEIPLIRYLCSERALKEQDDSCLKDKGDNGSNMKENRRKGKENEDIKIKKKVKDAKEEL
ncbi:FGF signaling regulator protein canopy b isoform X2 [Andrena cerasifolii]|uniref:FGF signaling regulator protein canopy b isoform X2 n=1 Tax=Andrena cerasifolii TaxID=2819439 RepID=UPI004037D4E9